MRVLAGDSILILGGRNHVVVSRCRRLPSCLSDFHLKHGLGIIRQVRAIRSLAAISILRGSANERVIVKMAAPSIALGPAAHPFVGL